MKLLKSKTFIGAVCLMFALAISFGVLPKLASQKAETVSVLHAAREIEAGTMLTEEMLTMVESGSYGLPGEVAVATDPIIGAVVSENIHKGEYIWKTLLQTPDDYADAVKHKTNGLENGLCIVSVKIPSISAGVVNLLRTGCHVNVYRTGADGDGNIVVEKVLADMELFDVQNAAMETIDDVLRITTDTSVDTVPAFVVFRTSEDNAVKLIQLEKAQNMYLTLTQMEGQQ